MKKATYVVGHLGKEDIGYYNDPIDSGERADWEALRALDCVLLW